MTTYRLLLMAPTFHIRAVTVVGRKGWKPKLFKPVPRSFRENPAGVVSEDQCVRDSDIVVDCLQEFAPPNAYHFLASIEGLDAAQGFGTATHLSTLNSLLGQTCEAFLRLLVREPAYLEMLHKRVELARTVLARKEEDLVVSA